MRVVPPFLALCGLTLGLGACAMPEVPQPSVNPDRVSLSMERLTVSFFDGTSCTADIRTAKSGQFKDCGQVMSYDVQIQHASLAAGTVLEPMFEPYATITLHRPSDDRTWVWHTPQNDTMTRNGGSGRVKTR